jgi:hypothetical protein
LLNRKNSFIKEFLDKTQTLAGRITQRSTGRQKQAHFLPVGKLLVKERYRFKRNSFFAFAACELNVIRLNYICYTNTKNHESKCIILLILTFGASSQEINQSQLKILLKKKFKKKVPSCFPNYIS